MESSNIIQKISNWMEFIENRDAVIPGIAEKILNVSKEQSDLMMTKLFTHVIKGLSTTQTAELLLFLVEFDAKSRAPVYPGYVAPAATANGNSHHVDAKQEAKETKQPAKQVSKTHSFAAVAAASANVVVAPSRASRAAPAMVSSSEPRIPYGIGLKHEGDRVYCALGKFYVPCNEEKFSPTNIGTLANFVVKSTTGVDKSNLLLNNRGGGYTTQLKVCQIPFGKGIATIYAPVGWLEGTQVIDVGEEPQYGFYKPSISPYNPNPFNYGFCVRPCSKQNTAIWFPVLTEVHEINGPEITFKCTPVACDDAGYLKAISRSIEASSLKRFRESCVKNASVAFVVYQNNQAVESVYFKTQVPNWKSHDEAEQDAEEAEPAESMNGHEDQVAESDNEVEAA